MIIPAYVSRNARKYYVTASDKLTPITNAIAL